MQHWLNTDKVFHPPAISSTPCVDLPKLAQTYPVWAHNLRWPSLFSPVNLRESSSLDQCANILHLGCGQHLVIVVHISVTSWLVQWSVSSPRLNSESAQHFHSFLIRKRLCCFQGHSRATCFIGCNVSAYLWCCVFGWKVQFRQPFIYSTVPATAKNSGEIQLVFAKQTHLWRRKCARPGKTQVGI